MQQNGPMVRAERPSQRAPAQIWVSMMRWPSGVVESGERQLEGAAGSMGGFLVTRARRVVTQISWKNPRLEKISSS
jgi:hypothetical protein